MTPMPVLSPLRPGGPLGPLRRFLDLRSLRLPEISLEQQQEWAQNFDPTNDFDAHAEAWDNLKKHTLPRLRSEASSFHQKGIKLFEAESLNPNTQEISVRLKNLTGWTLIDAPGEASSFDFFTRLANKEFPCNCIVRKKEEVFCGQYPDLWHELMGHLLPLASPEFSDFYQGCAELFLSETHPQRRKQIEQLLWIILEYGILEEKGQARVLGAAMSSSFIALERFRRQSIAIQDFAPKAALDSGLFSENIPPWRDSKLRVVFFKIKSLEDCLRQIKQYNVFK